MTDAKRDNNSVPTLIGVSSADGVTPVTVYVDPVTHRMLVQAATGSSLATLSDVTITSVATGDMLYYNGTVWVNLPIGTSNQVLTVIGGIPSWHTPSAGSGTVTTVSVATANGVSGTVANPTTTPAITLTLGTITPTSVNGLTITTSTGTLTIGALKTATFSNTLTFTGTDGSSVAFGAGGTAVYTSVTTLASLTSAASLATVGTITSGTWNGTQLGVQWGGTGLSNLTAHAMMVGTGVTAVNLILPGTAGNVLTSNGASADPSFQAPAGGGSYTLITSATLGSPATSVGVTGMTTSGYSYLVFEIVISSFGSADEAAIQFNADTSSNYSLTVTKNLNGTVTGTATASIATLKPQGGTTNAGLITFTLKAQNVLANKKTLVGQLWNEGQQLCNSFAGEWINTSANITAISVFGSAGAALGTGSSVRVYGIT